ncbi:MAG TPA: hypothetical protein VG389_14365 [Myxococcota bacterium]|jgi:hypothetical protein|nr:hypothetical protein [Myxococcota bacterium]
MRATRTKARAVKLLQSIEGALRGTGAPVEVRAAYGLEAGLPGADGIGAALERIAARARTYPREALRAGLTPLDLASVRATLDELRGEAHDDDDDEKAKSAA